MNSDQRRQNWMSGRDPDARGGWDDACVKVAEFVIGAALLYWAYKCK